MGSGGETNTPGQILARASAEGQPARDADKTSSAPDDAAADDDGFAVGQRSFSLSRGGALAEQESLGVEFARALARPNSAPSAAAAAAQVSLRCARTLPSSMAPSSSSSFAHRTAPVQSSPRSGPRASSAQLGRNLPRPARSGAPVARSPLLFSFSCLKHKVRFSDCEISAPATPGVVIRCSPSASSEKESSPLPRSEDAN